MYSEDIQHFIQEYKLIEPEDRLIIAVSGGPDSMCLLHYIITLKERFFPSIVIYVAHINHHTRGEENTREENLIKSYCELYQLVFYKTDFYFNGTGNFHDLARQFRYHYFKEVSVKTGANKIVLAHHKDDQVETVLFKVLRGSHLQGYSGMKVNYEVKKDLKVIRPFIHVTKQEILNYCQLYQIPYLTDSSNQKNDYARNYIRHEIVPKLHHIQSDASDKIIQFQTQIEEANQYVYETAETIFENAIKEQTDQKIVLDVNRFTSYNNAILRTILIICASHFNDYKLEISFNQINQMIEIIIGKKPNVYYDLGSNYYFIKEYNLLIMQRGKDHLVENELEINECKEYILPNADKLIVKKVQEKAKINNKNLILCYNNSMWPLKIRTRKDGDVIKTKIGHKKINRIFINHKIPISQRDSWPILIDKDGQILWVIGLEKIWFENEQEEGSIYIQIEVK